jgi:hypothetical protein
MRGGGGRGTYDDETCFLKKKRERPGHLAGLGRSGLIAHRAALMGWGGASEQAVAAHVTWMLRERKKIVSNRYFKIVISKVHQPRVTWVNF